MASVTWPSYLLTICTFLLLTEVSATDIVSQSRPSPSEDFTHSASIDEYNRFHLFWKFDDEEITFEIHAQTLGWIGLGFSPNGRMLASDIFMAWVKDGQAYGQDRYAEVDESQPTIDEKQDWKLLMRKEELGYTVIKVKRKRITCDEQDFKITEDTVRMIYAWNDEDPVDENSPLYHGATQRGSKSMYFIEYGTAQAESDKVETTYTWDMRTNNVSLPAERTTYWCTLFKVPSDRKVHVTKIAPLINKNNTGVVHHIVIYGCSKNVSGYEYNDRCRQKHMPVDLRSCIDVVFGWGVGGLEFKYPKDVGFPLGGDGDQYLMLEMHYDNPQFLPDVVDNSGLRLTYTYDYRQYEAGTAYIGEIIYYPPMIIPPNAKNFTIEAYCSTDCTSDVIPPTGIYVIANFLHTHVLGRKISTRHIRNGKELPELARDDHYDFDYQQQRYPKKPILVLPGDEFITTCVYDSRSRSKVTFSGEGTDEEMCLNFISYYPKSKFKGCFSLTQDVTPVYNYVMEKAMTGEIHIDPETEKRENKTFYDYLDYIDWTEEEVDKFQKMTLGSHRYREFCQSQSPENDDDDDDDERKEFSLASHRYRLTIEEPYKPKDVCYKEAMDSHASMPSTSQVLLMFATLFATLGTTCTYYC